MSRPSPHGVGYAGVLAAVAAATGFALFRCERPVVVPSDGGEALDAAAMVGSPRALCAGLAEAACEAWGRCGCGDALGWWDLDACRAVARLECASAIASEPLVAAVERGEVRFEPERAAQLLETVTREARAGCEPRVLPVEPVFVGARSLGETCERVADVVETCAPDLRCVGGVCRSAPLAGAGEPCPCAEPYVCDASAARGGLCAAAVTPGAGHAGDACEHAAECESLLCIERCTPAACRWVLRADGDAWLVLPGP